MLLLFIINITQRSFIKKSKLPELDWSGSLENIFQQQNYY